MLCFVKLYSLHIYLVDSCYNENIDFIGWSWRSWSHESILLVTFPQHIKVCSCLRVMLDSSWTTKYHTRLQTHHTEPSKPCQLQTWEPASATTPPNAVAPKTYFCWAAPSSVECREHLGQPRAGEIGAVFIITHLLWYPLYPSLFLSSPSFHSHPPFSPLLSSPCSWCVWKAGSFFQSGMKALKPKPRGNKNRLIFPNVRLTQGTPFYPCRWVRNVPLTKHIFICLCALLFCIGTICNLLCLCMWFLFLPLCIKYCINCSCQIGTCRH